VKYTMVIMLLLIFVSSAVGSPQQPILESADGVTTTSASLTHSPSSLSFGVVLLQKLSTLKTITLTNVGTTTLTSISFAMQGDFSMPTKTCGTTLAALASCKLSIGFKPVAIGTRTGSVRVSYSGGTGSPQTATLSGIGTELALSTTRLNFGTQVLANKSAMQSLTLTNVGTTALTISAVKSSGDFAVAKNSCGSGIAAGKSCTVGVTFTPSALGLRSGTLSTYNTGGGSPALISLNGTSIPLPLRTDVISNVGKVNDYWISNYNPVTAGNDWANATYFTGDMAAYEATGNPNYLNLAYSWANANNWALLGGDTSRIADHQAAGDVYIKLYKIDNNTTEITHITNDILAMVNSSGDADWWWIDALNMAMPDFANLGVIYNNPLYWSKMYELYNYTKRIDGGAGLYNPSSYLWFRDATFLPPKMGPNGLPIYWSRGNGWVFAAHAKVLNVLPASDPHYQEYLTTLQSMAVALKVRQRSDGFWNVDLEDPKDFPGPETSGTSFFVFGMAWGINHNILSRATYLPIVVTAWNGLVRTAVQSSGFLGYVQGVGGQPSSSQPVTATSTSNFGVGAFLLAGAEVAKLAAISPVVPYPTSLNFGSQAVGTTSTPRTITITNEGSSLITFSQIVVTGNFAIQTNNCGATLAAQASCKVTTVFEPQGTGNLYGSLLLYDDGGASPQTVSLSGVGI
jgi:unsaturated rhamnogalacturonyl hydrolase